MIDNFEAAKLSFLEGLAHYQAQRLAEAQSCFEAALALVPGRVSTLTNLGATRVKLGRFDAALPVLEQACASEPANLEAWSYRALALAGLARDVEALACFDRALAIDRSGAALWLHSAQSQLRLDQKQAALASFDQALAIDPSHANAWSDRGSLLRELGRFDDAADSFEKAIAMGADAGLNGYYLASVRGEKGPATAPRAYVERLFDDYAAEFQTHLVNVLHYRAHEVLIQHLLRLHPRRFRSVFDLGCGTGLCGPLIKAVAEQVDGLDISKAMLEQARQLGVYGELIHADALQYLKTATRSDDLVLAADVFIYVGELAALFDAIVKNMAPGGLFCFTLELATNGMDVQLLPSLRYAHSEAYVRCLALASGLEVDTVIAAALREDQGQALAGLYVILRKP